MNTRPTEFVSGFVGSILALVVAFGVNLTDDQIASILGVVGWLPLLVTTVVAWQRGETLLPPKPEKGESVVIVIAAALVAIAAFIWIARNI